MKRKSKTTERKLRASMLKSCSTINEDDGVDPREYFKSRRNQKENRKTQQLCQQVARTLNLCINDCDDLLVESMFVIAVIPAPDSSCLMVHVLCDVDDFDHNDAMVAIQNQTTRLQFEIARSIHRKRVPNLLFWVSVAGGERDE